MFSAFVSFIVDLAGVTRHESEIFTVQLLFIFLAFPFRSMLNTPLLKRTNFSPSLGLKQILAALVGFFALLRLIEFRYFLILNFALVAHYLLLKVFANNPRSNFVVCILAFSVHLFASLHGMIWSYGVNYPSHFHMITMTMVIKMMYYVWDWKFDIKNHKLNSSKAITTDQTKHKENKKSSNSNLVELPEKSFLDMMCYCYCFPGIFVGPTLSYKEYKFFIDDKPKNGHNTTKLELASEISILALSILVIIFHRKFFNPEAVLDPKFAENGFLHKLFWTYFCFFIFRAKLMVAFCTSHLSIMIMRIRGLKQGQVSGLCRCFDFFQVEFHNEFRVRMSSWNIAIAKWLRFCYYEPMVQHFKVNKGTASSIVYFISGIWHGFYPSYTIGLMLFHCMVMCERYLFRLRFHVHWLVRYCYMRYLNLVLASAGVVFGVLIWENTVVVIWNLAPVLGSLVGSHFLLWVVFLVVKPKRAKQENAKGSTEEKKLKQQ